MDYKYIEKLVTLAKDDDIKSKNLLVEEFLPIITNMVKSVHAPGYDKEDLINESFKILFNCVTLYDLSKHRFVGYAITAIRNNFNYILRKSIKRNEFEGVASNSLSDDLEFLLGVEEDLEIHDDDLKNYVLKSLTNEERELVDLVVFNDYSIKEYAKIKNLKYSTVAKRKTTIFNKIKIPLNRFIDNPINLHI